MVFLYAWGYSFFHQQISFSPPYFLFRNISLIHINWCFSGNQIPTTFIKWIADEVFQQQVGKNILLVSVFLLLINFLASLLHASSIIFIQFFVLQKNVICYLELVKQLYHKNISLLHVWYKLWLLITSTYEHNITFKLRNAPFN